MSESAACARCGYDKANHKREAHAFIYPDGEAFLAGLDDLGDCTPEEAVEAVKAVRAETATPSIDDLVGIVKPNRMRVGRKVGRTIYEQYGPEPSDDDPLIGVMDTPELAFEVVKSVNRKRGFDD